MSFGSSRSSQFAAVGPNFHRFPLNECSLTSVAPNVLDFRHPECCRRSGLMVVGIDFGSGNSAAVA